MKKLSYLLTAVLAMFATSCIEHHVTIELNKDGSGKVIEETLFGAQMLAMIEQMAGAGNPGQQENPLEELRSKKEAEKKASEMGEGVTLVSVENVEQNGSKGARVTYAFEDINKVDFSKVLSMDDMGPQPQGAAPEEEKPTTSEFSYADGVLTVTNPALKNEEPENAGEVPPTDPAQMAQAKQMMDGMKMSMKLVVPGGIAETNATHVDGNTVTFMEMNMGKILEHPDAFEKLNRAQAESPAEMQAVLEGIDGMKGESKEKVTLKLK
mgnify:CR=1 FL=1